MAWALHPPHYQDESAKQQEEGNEHVSVKAIQAGSRELLAASKAVKRPGFYLESLGGQEIDQLNPKQQHCKRRA